MSAGEKLSPAPEYPAATINMDYSSPIAPTATAPQPLLNTTAPPYAVQAEGNYLYQAAGWNPVVYPPPPAYNEIPGQPQPVIVPQIIFKTELGDNPGLAVCPVCNVPCTTSVQYKSGCLTILLCCLLFMFGCVLGCFLIPCCVKGFKDVNHYCPNCKHLIYKYKRL
ncbi:lipopolysaccharide-induced tumor necrosis factor-alpha factor homolog isoform X2 [Phyllobates terribilis]|uniref:lipopolysaccharide-induced tumor necrosis factor-alpha factor homolog isoform X2 n=1 Tax=Phyllobates terribilis TaxID=111132 RepID=UPI003CCACE5D